MKSNPNKNWQNRLLSALISLCICSVFLGCYSDAFEGCGLQGRRGSPPPPPRPQLPIVTTILSTNQVSVMQADIVSVIVDSDAPSNIVVSGFNSSLENLEDSFIITTSTCTSSNANVGCEEWFITPEVDAVPGDYEMIISPQVENANRFGATIVITVESNLSLNSAPAAISISGDNGVRHVLTSDQNRWSWANGNDESNVFGAAGVRSYYDSSINKVNPYVVDIAAPDESNVIWSDVQGNSQQGLAVDTNGQVFSWGNNTSALGFTSVEPVPNPLAIPDINAASSVAATSGSSFAIINGEVMGWGSNFEGIRGVGNSEDPWRTEFEIVNNITDAIQLAAGDNHMLALSSDGQVWSWGSNGMGQQGNGNIGAFSVTVSTINSLSNIVQIAASGDFSLALRDDGTVWAWGSNRLGQLGVNSAEASIPTPTQVVGLNNVREIAAMTLNRIPYAFAIDFAPIDNFTQPRPYRWGGGIAAPELVESEPAYNIGNGLFTDYNCGIVTLADGTQSQSGFLWDISDRSIVIPKLISFFGRNDPSCRNKLFLHSSPAEGGSITTSPDGGQFLEFDSATEVVLTVVANPGWEIDPIAPWSGNEDCNDGIVTVQGGVQCIAHFIPANAQQLTIQLTGTGVGDVTSQPTGINCGENCSAFYSENSTVTLTATPDTNSEFVGWTGDSACTNNVSDTVSEVVVAQATSCIATFNSLTAVLTVSKLGNGDGIITSDITAIDCGQDCDESLDINTQIILTPTADANSTFASWSGTGDCSNPTTLVDNSISITVSQDSECTATFDPVATGDFVLTVIINGEGEVNSTETPIPLMQCLNSAQSSTTCSVSYSANSSVTLESAIFFPNNTQNITGCDSFVGTNPDCFVTMDQDKTVTYDFSQSPEFQVDASVTGAGRIISFAAGGEVGVTGHIDCPATNCSDTFTVPTGAPTQVTFEAHPTTGSSFVSWGVDQCDTEGVTNGVGICNIDLVAGSATTRLVDATFQ